MSATESALPVPQTAEELNRLAQRRAAFLAEAERLRSPDAAPASRPAEVHELRPADFAAVARRILEQGQRSGTATESVSNEELHRREVVAARLSHLLGGDRGNRPRISGVKPDIIRLVCESVGKPPVVEGHKGTVLAAKRAEQFLADRRFVTLVLSGLTGLGKSTAAAWLFAEQRYGEWLGADEVRNDPEWHQRRKGLQDGFIVYIDDLGRETTPFATAELASLIERRHDAGKRTVVTTNLLVHAEDRAKVPAEMRSKFPAGQSVAERYGERVASRLSDDRTLVAWMGGHDLRRTAR